MTLRIDTKKILNGLALVLLFFASMNFQAKFFYFVFATLFVLALTQKRFLANPTMFVYLALGGLMSVYNMNEGLLSMLRCMANLALYAVGYNMIVFGSRANGNTIEERNGYMQKTGISLLITVSLGSFTHFVLNYLNNSNNVLVRNTNDIWTGQIMAATGQATLACLMLGLSIATIVLPKKKIYRYIGIGCIALALTYNLVLAGRTMVAAVCILFIIALLYARKSSTNSYERFKVLFGFVIGLLALLVLFLYNVGGIRDFVFDSNLFERFKFTSELFEADARSNGKIAFLQNAWKYPFGGLNLRSQYGYAHDLLLDGYDEYGMFGFIFLVMILVMGIKSLYRLIRYSSYSRYVKISFLCVYSSVLLMFCVEPILAGMSWLFACFCLINGCMDGMLIYDKRRKL